MTKGEKTLKYEIQSRSSYLPEEMDEKKQRKAAGGRRNSTQ